jgi:hypothetical protein
MHMMESKSRAAAAGPRGPKTTGTGVELPVAVQSEFPDQIPSTSTVDDDDEPEDEHEDENEAPEREKHDDTEAPEEFERDDEDRE